MEDLAFLVLVLLFFLVSWLYVRGCDRIGREAR